MAGTDKVKKENTMAETATKPVKETRAIDTLTGKYTIKPFKKTWLARIDKNHDGARLFEGAKAYIAPERDRDTGNILTGLTDQMARELEKDMGLKEQSLSPYNHTYWSNFKLYAQVPQDGLVLDLDRSALDKVRYSYLKACSKVALSSIEASEGGNYDYIMTSLEKEAQIDSSKIKLKLEASKKLSSMSIEEQMEFLKVYEEGKYKMGKSASADSILAAIGKVADENPEKFLDLVNDPTYKTKAFLHDCISIGAIRKSGSRYVLAGGDILGYTLADAVENLMKPENSEIKVSLKAKLDAIK